MILTSAGNNVMKARRLVNIPMSVTMTAVRPCEETGNPLFDRAMTPPKLAAMDPAEIPIAAPPRR